MTGKPLHVLVIAHPDDESMFFLPTIRGLKASNETLWILCLTTGDYDGLGRIREKELHRAGILIGADRVIVRDTLKDHPNERWEIGAVEEEIRTVLTAELSSKDEKFERIVLLTFDSYGVSGHVNHVDTFLGVQSLIRNGGLKIRSRSVDGVLLAVEGWKLLSETNPIVKYIPLISWILLIMSWFVSIQTMQRISSDQVLYRLNHPQLNWNAMKTHESQFVWYRRLFVVFSCYTYANTLKKIQ